LASSPAFIACSGTGRWLSNQPLRPFLAPAPGDGSDQHSRRTKPTITEPAPSGEASATTTQKAVLNERQQARKRLLLVDDLPSIRDSLSRLLRRQGYDVVLAENGREAVERVANERFDLVLLDLTMPVLDGWEALKRIAALRPGMPVVIMTAHSHQRPWVEPAGAWALLEKPLDIPLLLATIHELTEQSPASRPPASTGRQGRFQHFPPQRAKGFSALLSKWGINE
jgi:CheY-like chemotaxis protein